MAYSAYKEVLPPFNMMIMQNIPKLFLCKNYIGKTVIISTDSPRPYFRNNWQKKLKVTNTYFSDKIEWTVFWSKKYKGSNMCKF